MPEDVMVRAALVRTGALFVPCALLLVAWIAGGRFSRRTRVGMLYVVLWNFAVLFAVNVVAVEAGWWRFDAEGGLLGGVPVDLVVGWAVLWGAVAMAALRRLGTAMAVMVAVVVAIGLDLLVMPMLGPIVVLGRNWLVGEAVTVGACLVPGLLLGMWTRRDIHLGARVVLLLVLFSVLSLWLVPLAVLERVGQAWAVPWPDWLAAILIQFMLLAALPGVIAVQDLYEAGKGTPVPLDPPRRLVRSGMYRYVSNPMQVSMVLVFGMYGLVLGSWLIGVGGLVAVAMGAGFARWHTNEDMSSRFGDEWEEYRRRTPSWWPRWRPDPMTSEGVLYVARGCRPCGELWAWLARKRPVGLRLEAAESSGRSLRRVRYEDAQRQGDGVVAVAMALEHINLGWALVGAVLRIWPLCFLWQLFADAVGGEAREIAEG